MDVLGLSSPTDFRESGLIVLSRQSYRLSWTNPAPLWPSLQMQTVTVTAQHCGRFYSTITRVTDCLLASLFSNLGHPGAVFDCLGLSLFLFCVIFVSGLSVLFAWAVCQMSFPISLCLAVKFFPVVSGPPCPALPCLCP